jgi:hypothetical protein
MPPAEIVTGINKALRKKEFLIRAGLIQASIYFCGG